MAKKAVASLQSGSKKLTKAIRMIKKDGSDSYSFDEKILPQDLVNDWLAGKPIDIDKMIHTQWTHEVTVIRSAETVSYTHLTLPTKA